MGGVACLSSRVVFPVSFAGLTYEPGDDHESEKPNLQAADRSLLLVGDGCVALSVRT